MKTSGRAEGLRGGAAYEFFHNLPLPAFHIDRERGLYMVNLALAEAFGYENTNIVEDIVQKSLFFSTHFNPESITSFFEAAEGGRVRGLLMPGQTLDGRDVALEINADIRLAASEWRIDYANVFFASPSDVCNVESVLEKAQQETELAMRAKNEFLSNISHELRTPLNIIIGMLNMAAEDEDIPPESRENLALARDAADGLFYQLNDLILLSNLEARRLTSDPAQFTPEFLVKSLIRKFANAAAEKNIALDAELDESKDDIFEGGYNLIHMALEKLLNNAIKFSRPGGQVLIRAGAETRGDGPWLFCEVSDSGPGLDECFLDGGEDLVRQGDASMNRQYGGLGLGLRLTGGLIRHLGGDIRLSNRQEGGASPAFSVPIRVSTVEFAGNE
jgi:signal transduction histidine kinase